MWIQRTINLNPYPRGFHIITEEVYSSIPELSACRIGILNVFIKHTSASLSINENTDYTVRLDLEMFLNKAVPEKGFPYLHNYEGEDDMPAHIKAALLGSSVQVPVQNGVLALGTWQGIYLGEHRDHAPKRQIVLTLLGE